jgi:hypothetical protein
MHSIKRAALVTAFSAAVLGVAGPAWGIAYGTLTAYDDQGRRVATDYGSVYKSTSNGDRLAVNYHTDDRLDNRHASVTKVYWSFNGSYCYPSGQGAVGCGSGWYGAGSAEGPRTNTARSGHLFKQLSSTADSARASVEVCEDQGTFNPDECSPRAIRGISY